MQLLLDMSRRAGCSCDGAIANAEMVVIDSSWSFADYLQTAELIGEVYFADSSVLVRKLPKDYS